MTITEALPEAARGRATGPDGTAAGAPSGTAAVRDAGSATGDGSAMSHGSAVGHGSAMNDNVAKGSGSAIGHGLKKGGDAAAFRPVPVWFFAFEGLMGAAYDIVKSHHDGWMVLAACAVVNLVLARTVMRGRLAMAKAMLKGKRTRKIAVGLIALRFGVHAALGAVGLHATSGPAHIAFAVGMCAATVAMLAFDQKVMLRALAAA